MKDAFLIIARLARLLAELAGYVYGLSQNGIAMTIRNMFQLGDNVANPISGFGLTNFALSGFFIVVLFIADVFMWKKPEGEILKHKPLMLRWAGYYVLIFAILLSWSAGSSQFIYFTF